MIQILSKLCLEDKITNIFAAPTMCLAKRPTLLALARCVCDLSKVTRYPAKESKPPGSFPRMSEAMATNEVEFKLLSDQLNSACEDFGILQANGFTVQDEIHQGNSFEPQFRGWISGVYGTNHSLSSSYLPYMKFLQEEIGFFLFESPNYEFTQLPMPDKKKSTDSIKTCDDLKFCYDKSKETTILFEKPYNQEGRRLWTIRLCNCKNPHNKNSCTKEDCHRFQITWKKDDGVSEEEEKFLAFELWFAFEVVPQYRGLSEYPCLLEVGFGREKAEAALEQKAKLFKSNEFAQMWGEIKSLSKEPSEEPSKEPSEEPSEESSSIAKSLVA
eukprot:GHVP01021020.1.p1 GENE.GHVP01021020.1~~GHVP01021020.1.p1  ORF type:complete len:329 (+),score=35.65 GHVP01021020.1:955-1941(+)